MIPNMVAHCYDSANNADKVYMCCIRTVTTKEFIVLAKWGRRHAKMNVQVKGTYDNLQAAESIQQIHFKSKLNIGYWDITSLAYTNFMQKQGMTPLTMQSGELKAYLEGTPIGTSISMPEKEKELEENVEDTRIDLGPVDKSAEEDDVMVCVDNTGIEADFDVGIEYVVEKHADPQMIYAYNKMGKKLECFRKRFIHQKTDLVFPVLRNLCGEEGKMMMIKYKRRDPYNGYSLHKHYYNIYRKETIQPSGMR